MEPNGSLNVGSVARLCANFEVDELRLVSPRCQINGLEAKKMALKGKNFLENSIQFDNLIDAVSDCSKVIATCGRIDHGEICLNSADEALPWFLNNNKASSIAIVFGREDRGLTNEELLIAQKVISIRTSSNYPSLNLSHSVAILLHEIKSFNESKLSNKNSKAFLNNTPANPIEINDFIKDAQSLFLEIGFLLDHTAKSRMAKIKGLLHRADIRSEEISLIRGILRQVRWALSSKDN